jgi:2-polyprenyl-3-methyl-5-hydroxy-6-metoxy-1,4-benzoquinol methylase
MKKIENCPICNATERSDYLKVEDFSTSQEEFTISQCKSCGFLFTNPIPDENEIDKYYDNPNYISHTNSSTGLFGSVYQFLRKRALRKKLGWIEAHMPSGTLVDYGSGTGEFINHCMANGWRAHGYEISESARNMAKTNYDIDVRHPNAFSDLEDQSVDVISLWHVLEHLPDLKHTIERMSQKLKVGGLLVLALPNPESWDAQKYGRYWAAWDVPIHFYHFKKQDIKRLAEQTGLSIVDVINMPFDAYYVSLLSEEYKTGSKNWINAAYAGWMSNRKAGKSNASSLTYILKKT